MAKQRILIVDDNPANTILLERILAYNYEIDSVDNGEDALALIAKQPFDLILLDIMMPGINGLDVLKRVRQDFNSNELPIILISALTEREHIVVGLRSGANDYLTKPIEPQIVQARVETQLELKSLSDEREQLMLKLEQANQMRNRLMRIASHDLKNPINTLNMALQIMEQTGNQQDKTILNMAHKSVRQMHNIVMEFLDMDILKDDDVNVHIDRVSIELVIDELVETFAFSAQEKDIQLHVSVLDDDMMADAKRVQQVLNNLVSNAIKYSPFNSRIQICVETIGRTARIHVMDEGSGIPENEQAQLFQPFAKISTQPTAGEDSTGLGLWIAQQMMDVQNGKIGLYSEAGKGCDFWIELPLATKDETIPSRAALFVS